MWMREEVRRRVDDHDEAVTRARRQRQRQQVFGRGSDCSEGDEVRECLGFLWRGRSVWVWKKIGVGCGIDNDISVTFAYVERPACATEGHEHCIDIPMEAPNLGAT